MSEKQIKTKNTKQTIGDILKNNTLTTKWTVFSVYQVEKNACNSQVHPRTA